MGVKWSHTVPHLRQLGLWRMPSCREQNKYPIKLIKIKHDASSLVSQSLPSFSAV